MKVSDKFRRQERHSERGVTMVLVAISMVAIIAMAALSIDVVTLYLAREEAQRTADTAALAAARIISASGITGTLDPASDGPNWRAICGGATGWATQAATAVAAQNNVSNQSATVTVTYSDGSTFLATDCSTLSPAFNVNPMVTVQLSGVSIPSFFSRIWGTRANNVSATATAEAFNPSGSGVNGIVPSSQVTPVQPRCVKPWLVPNVDPGNCPGGGQNCQPFVNLPDGQIENRGISLNGGSGNGVIGETFNLFADCGTNAGDCGFPLDPPTLTTSANIPLSWGGLPFRDGIPNTPNLVYAPGELLTSSLAVPSCASGGSNYEQAVAGCDQTVYQCGLNFGSPNDVDNLENPSGASGDTAMGVACMLTPATPDTIPLSGQDTLVTSQYPFVALAGSANGLGIANSPVTGSPSVVSLPIFDQTTVGRLHHGHPTPVNIVGFLQVFINQVPASGPNAVGGISVTVVNVAGCGSNASTNAPITGNSPVPIRLITPPTPP